MKTLLSCCWSPWTKPITAASQPGSDSNSFELVFSEPGDGLIWKHLGMPPSWMTMNCPYQLELRMFHLNMMKPNSEVFYFDLFCYGFVEYPHSVAHNLWKIFWSLCTIWAFLLRCHPRRHSILLPAAGAHVTWASLTEGIGFNHGFLIVKDSISTRFI